MSNRLLLSTCFIVLSVISYHCNRGPYAAANKSYKKQVKQLARIITQIPPEDSVATKSAWVGTTNFNLRKPNFVILHHTAQNNCEETLKTFTTPRSQVSAHYVICKDGTIHHMLNDYLRAWHGGVAKWGNTTDINSSSIGIEIDNNGFEPFSEAQINSLLALLNILKKAHNIPAANFLGHSDIAPTRKVDPNVYFPWKKLADNGFGLWWSDTTNVTVPEYFNTLEALRIVGFDVKDSTAAFRAFKQHFVQDTTRSPLNDAQKKILYSLYKKYQ
ncbi:MAG: N-acetylmuramoyl-L-alanine amidase [Chitinophagaceae bacterium]|nr:N-acetylmuramoyl-L-alanine amidase [Chitinophagaceae bacterium]